MTITFRDLSYKVQLPGDGGNTLQILNNVNGHCVAGRLTAILGQSGSGKTTLLDTLAQRKVIAGKDELTGDILVNGKPIPSKSVWRRQVGYVQQHDQLLASSTVKEALMFTTRLRTPYSTTYQEHTDRVNRVLKELGLEHRADSRIGAPGEGSGKKKRGLSGGELRRVTIAQELVADVKILMLDEPTSGLDSTTARQIMELLLELAQNENRTIASTIHQPNSTITALFDDVLLLAKGEVCYYGKWSNVVEHFSKLGYDCPMYTNPADTYMDLLANKEDARRLADHYNANVAKYMSLEGVPVANNDEVVSATSATWSTPFHYQTRLLVIRGFRQWARSPLLFVSELVQYVFFGFFIALMYNGVSDNVEAGLFDRSAGIFFILGTLCFIPSFTVITIAEEERALLRRESSSGYYRLAANYVAKILYTWPFELLLTTIFALACYFIFGLKVEASAFFLHLVVLILFQLISETLGLLCAYGTPNATLGVLVLSLIMLVCLSLGGFLVSEPKDYYDWFGYINYYTYAYVALLRIECEDLMLTTATGQEVNALDVLIAEDRLRNDLSIGENIAVLFGMLVFLRAIAFIGQVKQATSQGFIEYMRGSGNSTKTGTFTSASPMAPVQKEQAAGQNGSPSGDSNVAFV